MELGWQFSVRVECDEVAVPAFVFTYVDGIGLFPNQVVGTDSLGRYTEQNYASVKIAQRGNGCVDAHNEGNVGNLSTLREHGVEQVTVKRIFPTYL